MNKKDLRLIVLSLTTAFSNASCGKPGNADVEIKDFNLDGRMDYAIDVFQKEEGIVFISNPDGTYSKGYKQTTKDISLIEYVQ